MEYRYNLDKSSKKFHCPNCNKKTFVRYFDIEKKEYLPIEFGRCDRENNCGYHSTPKGEFTNTYEVKFTPPLPTSYHPYNLVSQSGRNYKQNNFIQFLKTIFSESDIKKVILKYLMGTSKFWDGATVFWQIDSQQKVRHGKVMLYDIETGKRSKKDNGKAFIHSVRSLLKLDNFNLKQCLFGLHLINENETRTVGLVESEKTAIIMSLFKPQYVWLATGSLQGFKYEMLKPIKDYNIIAFPDKSEYPNWLNRAMDLNDFGFKIKVSKAIENLECKKGTDLADIYLDEVRTSTQKLKPVIRTESNIKATVTQILSIAEMKVKKLMQKNNSLLKLIDVFDLTDENGIPINA
jgi:hypothetical protein